MTSNVKQYLHTPCRTRTFVPARQAEHRAGGLQWCCHCKENRPVVEFTKVEERNVKEAQ